MNLTCTVCGNQFVLVLKLPMPISDFVAKTEAAKCPDCGAGCDKLRCGHHVEPSLPLGHA